MNRIDFWECLLIVKHSEAVLCILLLLLNRQGIKMMPGVNAVTYNVHIWHITAHLCEKWACLGFFCAYDLQKFTLLLISNVFLFCYF